MKIATYILLFSFFNGCSIVESEEKILIQEFLFEVEYVNWAWGFSHSAIYIDNSGNVYKSKIDSSKHFTYYGKEYYTKSELIEKYSYNNEFVKHIAPEIIERYKALIESAINGSHSDPVQRGADQGQMSYSCFSLANSLYRKSELKVEGDWSYQIETAEADSIVNWLKSVGFLY